MVTLERYVCYDYTQIYSMRTLQVIYVDFDNRWWNRMRVHADQAFSETAEKVILNIIIIQTYKAIILLFVFTVRSVLAKCSVNSKSL